MPIQNKTLTINDEVYKQCSKCKRFKTVDCFAREKNGLYQVRGTCKQCRSKESKYRYHYDPVYREKIKESSRKRYQLHKETIKKQVKEWMRKHPSYVNQYVHRWQQENREYYQRYIREYQRQRRRKKLIFTKLEKKAYL